jgi:hypothetical protein
LRSKLRPELQSKVMVALKLIKKKPQVWWQISNKNCVSWDGKITASLTRKSPESSNRFHIKKRLDPIKAFFVLLNSIFSSHEPPLYSSHILCFYHPMLSIG